MGLVSVIVSVYNSEKYIGQCICSIVEQTYKELEIILVDDGTPDKSGDICDEWARRDDRIKVIHQKNGGPSAAQNTGLDNASGQYLMLVDGDDWISPDMIEKLLRTMEDQDADISIGSYYDYIDGETVDRDPTSDRKTYGTKDAVRELIKDKSIHNFAWGKLYKRETFHEIRFPIGEDYDDVAIMHLVFMNAKTITYIPDRLYYYRQHEASILHNRTLDLSVSQYMAYKKQRKDILPVWPELELELDRRDYPFFISTMFFYYRKYKGQKEYTEKMQRIKKDLIGCHTRLRQKNKLSMGDEFNYFRVMYLEPIIRR